MHQHSLLLRGVIVISLFLSNQSAFAQDPSKKYPFVFRDVGQEAGLFPHLEAIKGHGAAWGDLDGDGFPSLYVATFFAEGSKANMLLRNNKGKFTLDDQKALNIACRGTGVVFADLDNDGDLDLYLGSMPKPAGKDGVASRGCSMFRNDGNGKFTDISKDNDACPAAFGGRSVAVLDYDGDGLL
ncbi:MAG: VCBS repeat-containing protein, partial [Planctomycetes bacterium]|nr:VCBS repeat-containing protein [Planctomycetota bacterium]